MNELPTENLYGAPSTEPTVSAQNQVSELAIDLLRRTKTWVLFLAVLGYIACAFMALISLVLLLGGGFMATQMPGNGRVGFTAIGVIYLAFTAFYLFPCIKLHQYSSSIKVLLRSRSSIDLETALDKQRGFWKFCGIIALITISLYVVLFGSMIIVGAIGAATR